MLPSALLITPTATPSSGYTSPEHTILIAAHRLLSRSQAGSTTTTKSAL
jgi:hypothetical protein